MREDTITRQIQEKYTAEELADRAKNLAGKLADLETVASDKKAADATFNERKKVLEAEIETIYRQYNKGYELAQVGCDIRYNDPSPGQKSIYRMDTHQHVETVDMSWEEKQEELQFNLNAPLEGQPQPSDDQVNDILGEIAKDTDAIIPPPTDVPPDAEAEAND